MKTSKEKLNSQGFFEVFKYVFNGFILFIKNIALLPFRIIGLIFSKIGNLFRFSLTFKINIVYTLSMILILFFVNISIISSFRYLILLQQKSELSNNHISILELVESNTTAEDVKNIEATMPQGLKIDAFDTDSNVLYTNHNTDITLLEGNFSPKMVNYLNKDYLIQVSVVSINGEVIYLQTAYDITFINENIEILILILIALSVAAVLIISTIGSKVSKNILGPISNMTDHVRDISVQNLSKRLNVKGAKDELKDLAITFNNMMDDIEKSYEKQNRFVSDASHELRTPISVVLGYVNLLNRWGKKDEQILDESIMSIKEEVESMKGLIENLLFLARSDKNKVEMEVQTISLDELVDEVCKETKMIDSKHEVICEINEKCNLIASRKYIKQALRIFIENSLKFTEEGGFIKITLNRSFNSIILSVEDSGIGIPEEDIPRVFDRFYRSDESRTKASGGTGLGLSIAKWILDQHDADVIVKSKEGVGTKISILFKEQ